MLSTNGDAARIRTEERELEDALDSSPIATKAKPSSKKTNDVSCMKHLLLSMVEILRSLVFVLPPAFSERILLFFLSLESLGS